MFLSKANIQMQSVMLNCFFSRMQDNIFRCFIFCCRTFSFNHAAWILNKAVKKRPVTNYTACLICQKTESIAGPLQKLTDQGYPAFLYAVANGKDDVSFRLENELEPQSAFLEKNPMWHTKCRAKHTNWKTVDQRKNKLAKQEGTSSEAGPSTERDSSAPKTLK